MSPAIALRLAPTIPERDPAGGASAFGCRGAPPDFEAILLGLGAHDDQAECSIGVE